MSEEICRKESDETSGSALSTKTRGKTSKRNSDSGRSKKKKKREASRNLGLARFVARRGTNVGQP